MTSLPGRPLVVPLVMAAWLVGVGHVDAQEPGEGVVRRAVDGHVADEVSERTLDAWRARVTREGRVRVIVGLGARAGVTAGDPPPAPLAIRRSRLLDRLGTSARVLHAFEAWPFVVVEVDGAGLDRLASDPDASSLEADVRLARQLAESVPLIEATTLFSAGVTGAGQTVAILDDGVDKTHPAFGGRVVSEACYSGGGDPERSVCPGRVLATTAPGSAVPPPNFTHGTHVAGIAAGEAGVAPGASIIAIQVFSSDELSYYGDLLAALDRVYALRAIYTIASVNLSLGGGLFPGTCDQDAPAMAAAFTTLRSAGIAPVVAAGNDGASSAMSFPACLSAAVSVGSTTKSDAVSAFSNATSFLQLMAPGSQILAPVPGGGTAAKSGTSMAAPHVAGAWALLRQSSPATSVASLLAALQATGAPVFDTRNGLTYPRLRVAAAADSLLVSVNPTAWDAPVGGGTLEVALSAPAGLAWTTSSSAPGWLSVSPGSGTGPATVTLSATSNLASTTERSGGVLIGGQVVSVSQAAGRYTLTLTKLGDATGTVTSHPPGVACGTSCTSATATFGMGEVVSLVATPGEGATFLGWGGACLGVGACDVTMTEVRVVTASFVAQGGATSLGEAVGAPALPWTTGGSAPWVAQTTTYYAGGSSAESGPVGDGEVSWIETSVTGPGVLAFRWRVSSEANYDFLALYVDGVRQEGAISGETGWVQQLWSLPAGLHVVRWQYEKDGSLAAGSDRGWLDEVVFTPAQSYALTITRAGSGLGTVTSSPPGIDCGTSCAAAYVDGTVVALTAMPGEGASFAGWSGACSGLGSCSVTMSAARSVTASFTPSAIPLDNDEVVADLAGAQGSTRFFYIDVPAGATSLVIQMSGGTGDADLYVRHAVEPTLSEWDCRPYTDGNAESCSSAAPASGRHFILIHGYSAYSGVSLKASFVPPGLFALTVSKTGGGSGTVVSSPSGISCGPACGSASAIFPNGTLVTLVADATAGSTFEGWSGACSGTGTCSVTMSAARAVTANFGLQATGPSLGDAVGSPTLPWTTGGDASWLGQTTVFYSGGAAAQSGTVDHWQSSWIQTMVTGPGTLRYRWRVSSEPGFDFLEFHFNGTRQTGAVSGETDWAEQVWSIPSGTHTLRWQYAKDGTVSAGQDRGWLDAVEFTSSTVPPPAPSPRHYYLAEGSTIAGLFDLEIVVVNPSSVAAPIVVTFLTDDRRVVTLAETVPATTRRTYRVGRDDVPGLAGVGGLSTVVTSSDGVALIVERTMTWDAARRYGGHGGTAVEAPSTEWYFAEGDQGFFDTYLLLANPSASGTAEATLTFLREGAPPVVATREIGPQSRLTLPAFDESALLGRSFAIEIESTIPIFAERAMYFGADPFWTGGHASAGTANLATQWFFAEGATGTLFDTYLLVGNPGTSPTTATFRFLLPDGRRVVGTTTVEPQRRFTLNIEHAGHVLAIVEGDPAWLADTAVSTLVESPTPIVAERAMYWPGTFATWTEAHNSFGLTETGVMWGVADVRRGGPLNFATYILLANPGGVDAPVRVTFIGGDGTTSHLEKTVTAGSRTNVDPDEMPVGEFGVVVESLDEVPIVVEKAMYWTPPGGPNWGGGTGTTATRLR